MRATPTGSGLKFSFPFALSAFVIGASLFWNGCAAADGTSPDVSQYVHRSWKIREGFASAYVEALAQTPDSYLWIGTEGGLYRFDGVRNVLWHPPPNQSLPDQDVQKLLVARDGRLWIGTPKGLASWKAGRFTRYREFEGKDTFALAEGRDGKVWAWGADASHDGVFCGIPPRGVAHCEHIRNTLRDSRPNRLLCDSRGTIWLVNSNEVWRWGPGTRRAYSVQGATGGLLDDPDHPGAVLVSTGSGINRLTDKGVESVALAGAPPSFTPLTLFRDRHGGVWIATLDKGIIHISGSHVDRFDSSDGLTGNFVSSIIQDHEGTVWVGTYNGLDSFHEPMVKTLSTRQGLSNSTVASVLAAKDGSVWLATFDGISRWYDGEIINYRGGESPPASTHLPADSAGGNSSASGKEVWDRNAPQGLAWSLFQDRSGRIWTSTKSGILYFENGHFTRVADIPTQLANSFAEDDAGLWIGYRRKGLYHLTHDGVRAISWEQLRTKEHGQSLFFDSSRKELWIGLFDGGVELLKDGQIAKVYTPRDGLGAGNVSQLQGDENGIWAATEGGLSRIKDGHATTLTSRNGLPCDGVQWMMRGKRHAYWLYTPCGLVRIPPEQMTAWIADPNRKLSFRVLDLSDGVRTQPRPIASSPLVTRTADGQIWFVPLDGVSVFDPQHLKLNNLPPPVHVEQIIANGQTHDPVDGLRLPPLVHDLTIDYTALSLVAPEKVHFRFKLEGQDRSWREYINERQVQYSNLAPGDYRFRVTASNDSGIWNSRGASLSFSITPAYWQTNWFAAVCAALGIGLLAALYQLRVNQVERAAERTRESQRHQHEVELELAHASRVATMGQLTASIAHEVNQPLAAIRTNAQAGRRWLSASPPDFHEVRQTLDGIVRDVTRAADIVSRIRGMITKAPENKANTSLKDIIVDVIAIVESEAIRQSVSIRTEFMEDGVMVKGDRVELQQVILNLMMNAIEAMSSTVDGFRDLIVRFEKLETHEVIVSVRDTGPGMPAEMNERVFKPYYTSKSTGMGLGLSICRTTVEAHGGRIWASDNVPHGAVFQFTLPISQDD